MLHSDIYVKCFATLVSALCPCHDTEHQRDIYEGRTTKQVAIRELMTQEWLKEPKLGIMFLR